MTIVRFILLFVLLAALPLATFWLGARAVKPAPFQWNEDPLQLLVHRHPVAAFPGAKNVRAIGDQITALYDDGSRSMILFRDDSLGATSLAAELVEELEQSGAMIQGGSPVWTFEQQDADSTYGILVVAGKTVVRAEGPTRESQDYRLFSIPWLVDRRQQDLARMLLKDHRLPLSIGLGIFLLLTALVTGRALRRSADEPGSDPA